MSDHFDTEDSRTDITDLYVFPSPQGGGRSVLVLDINPDASTLEVSFDPAASYELKIDTDGDLEADVAFHILFASSAHGEATATVYKALGAAARETGAVGEAVIADAPVSMNGSSGFAASNGYRFFAGLRSDGLVIPSLACSNETILASGLSRQPAPRDELVISQCARMSPEIV